MPMSRRSLLAAGAGSLAAAPAIGRAATLRTTANYTITNAAIHPNEIWLHGSYPPKNQRGLPKSFQYTLDGGRTWKQAGGFAYDNGGWDTWVHGIDLKPGAYTIAIRDSADHSEVVVAPKTYTINANTAPAKIGFSLIHFSTSLPTGSGIGFITASGGTPQQPLVLKLAAANSPGYAIDDAGGGKWRVSVGDQARLTAGTNRLAGRISSGPLGKSFSFEFPVAQGHVVPASAMIFQEARGLTNATASGALAFTLGMNGYSGGRFEILRQAAPANPDGHMKARYTLDGREGRTSNTLSAQTEHLTLGWTDGINTCVAEQSLAIASVLGTGPVIRVAGQGALSAKVARLQANARAYKGAIIVVAAGAYNEGWNMPGGADGWDDNGFFAPQTIMGARGVMPVMEQTGQWIKNGKGWLETWGWDVDVIGLEFANLFQSYPGEVGNFAGVKLNAGVLGKTRVQYVYAHNCTDGVLGGETGQVAEILDCEFAKNGGGDGYTHNFYLSTVSHALVRRVVSWGANVGHCGKIRAAAGVVEDCVFADGKYGCASYLLDLPDGGDYTVSKTTFEKGPNAQNGPMLRYGEEAGNHHPVNRLLVDGCTFINNIPNGNKLYNGSVVYATPVQFGLKSGQKAMAVIENCTFYGFTKSDAFRTDGPNATVTLGRGNRFLPRAAAPAPHTYITHPFTAGGYTSSTGEPAPYRTGPMQGR